MALPTLTQLGLAFQQPERVQPRNLPVFRDWDLESLTELEAEALGYLGPDHHEARS
jgi:hypothetical protein